MKKPWNLRHPFCAILAEEFSFRWELVWLVEAAIEDVCILPSISPVFQDSGPARIAELSCQRARAVIRNVLFSLALCYAEGLLGNLCSDAKL